MEKQLSGRDYDPSSDSFNIEHILPQNAPDGWGGFSYDESKALVDRLGNMTILNVRVNRDIGTEEYVEKRSYYENSDYYLTKRLAEQNEEWTPERISAWQSWMANQATAVWRIAQLSS